MLLEGGWREMRLGGGSGDLFLPCSEGPGVISMPSLVDFMCWCCI